MASIEQTSNSTAPHDELEATLTSLVEKFLDTKRIGVSDDLFMLGMTSLKVMQLILLLKTLFGVLPSASDVFLNPTVRGLSRILRQRMIPRIDVTADAIRQNGKSPPFFYVYGGNSPRLCKLLAQHLASNQNLYALRISNILDGKELSYIRLEDIAALHIQAIRAFQPTGPYSIGGHSTGALIAVEIASQLLARGEEVPLLAVFGRVTKNNYARSLYLRLRLLRLQVARMSGQLFGAGGDRQMMVNGQVAAKLQCARNSLVTIKTIRRAAPSYAPEPYPGQVVWFRPSRNPAPGAKEFADVAVAPSCERLTVHVLPGSQRRMFREPRVQALAKLLGECLTESARSEY